jgi:hypothetical protein
VIFAISIIYLAAYVNQMLLFLMLFHFSCVCVLRMFNLHTGNEAHNCLLVICLQPRRPVLFVGNHTMFGIYDSPILVHEVPCLLLPAEYFFTG